MNEWNKTADNLPKEGKIVMTKIHDQDGSRNEARLQRQGRLWFTPDNAVYVYYTPTHWREI